MKSLEELKAIRDKAKQNVKERIEKDGYKVIVGMATCGIAAGARPVMTTILDSVASLKLDDVTVTQTGCIGICRYEPIVEVIDPAGEKYTYIKMTPDRARIVIDQHVKHGSPVAEYLIGTGEKK